MDKEIINALYDGQLEIGEGYFIDSAVLDDENRTRVLNQGEISKALGKVYGGSKRGMAKMPRWISANNLDPYISDSLRMAILNPIMYKTSKGNLAHGIEATKLVDICCVWVDAEKDGKLHEKQQETAKNASVLIRALAKTSIISLIDEATGYQNAKDRAKNTLQEFLKRALQDEAAKWVKTFQDEFFEMIFKMKGWNWGNTVRRPGVVGHYINDLVYSRIAPNVIEDLRVKNPKIDGVRKKHHHSFFTPDFGHPILKEHIASLIALGRASSFNWEVFIQLVNKAFPVYGKTIEINFPETLEELNQSDNKNLSDFNQKLQQGLNWNPKDNKK